MNYERTDGRAVNELRAVKITPHYYAHAEGSALIEVGNTHIICVASVDERVPFFLKGKGSGWVTAEYSMLPRATAQRTQRESGRGGVSGRTQEIQRLIGRSLRAVMDMKALGERQILIDCDVLQADGGTRTASITGAYVALALACRKLLDTKKVARNPLKSEVAAISVGIHRSVALLDLKYDEDSVAETDMNVVCTGDGRYIEVQGTAEGAPFSQAEMNALLSLANEGITRLIAAQRQALAAA